MFDRFTHRARKVMGLARQEAQRFNHDYIGPEHMLLGLLNEGTGVGMDVLKNLDVDSEEIRREIEKRLAPGNTMVTMGPMPFTPPSKRVLELALEEASSLGHNYIGTEHLLLGLIREEKGIPVRVLRELHVRLEDVREEILELLGAEISEERPAWPRQDHALLLLGPNTATEVEAALKQACAACRLSTVTTHRPGHDERSPQILARAVGAAHVVVAAADDASPSLMWALGIAEGLVRRTLILSGDPDALPPPLRGLPVVGMGGDDPATQFAEALKEVLA